MSKLERCAANDCDTPPDRTTVWGYEDTGDICDYSYECRDHAIESATVPGMYPHARVVAVFAGLRLLDKII